MSDFLKLAYELIAQVIYFVVEWLTNVVMGFVKVFITGWVDYSFIFYSYFKHFGIIGKIFAILLALILIAIPIIVLIIIIKKIINNIKLKKDHNNNATLIKEIGYLNKQVLDLMDEKNKILAMKVNSMNMNSSVPYVGASALIDGENGVSGSTILNAVPVNGEVNTNGTTIGITSISGGEVGEETIVAAATAVAKAQDQRSMDSSVIRFPKLTLVDEKYADYVEPTYNTEITLEEFTEQYRCFACSKMKLYYTPEVIRRFIAGMSASKILILEGISGTGKTSLPYSFSRFLNNPCTMVPVQPSFRDRTELLGYFNEFSKKFNETEFLRALYEASYRADPSFIVLDEMNLARIEYYFAEMLSVLEMPSVDEWKLDLVPTEWQNDPKLLEEGKINISENIWYVGTANNDDSTFSITDKVYDRAIPIELNERADPFECEEVDHCFITSAHLEKMFDDAIKKYPISDSIKEKLVKMDTYLQTRFKLAFGNRIMKQMESFIPVYVACGGTELGGMDYIIARKVLKKFESMNVEFVRDEIKALLIYIEKTFGKNAMPDSKLYLTRIQNLY